MENSKTATYNKYFNPTLPALSYTLNIYLLLVLSQAFPLFSRETESTRLDNLQGVAIALGMVIIIFLFTYWRARRRAERGEFLDPLDRFRTEMPAPDKMRRLNRRMVYTSAVALFLNIFITRYLLRLSEDWNFWWSAGASAVYAAMAGALIYWHYIWKPEKEAHE